MITVEHMLQGLTMLVIKGVITDKWHRDFITNVSAHVSSGSVLSTNQGTIVLKVARAHTNNLSSELKCLKIEVRRNTFLYFNIKQGSSNIKLNL
jgi:glutamine amidotransferase PdxT